MLRIAMVAIWSKQCETKRAAIVVREANLMTLIKNSL